MSAETPKEEYSVNPTVDFTNNEVSFVKKPKVETTEKVDLAELRKKVDELLGARAEW